MTNNELRRLALEQREVLLARLGNTPVDAWRFNGIEAMIVLSALNLAAVAERQEPAPFRERVKSVEHLIQAGCGEDRLSWDMAVAIDRKYSEWFSPAPQPTGVGAVWRTRGAFYRAAWFSGRTRHGFRLARTARWLSEDGQRLNSPAAEGGPVE